MIIEPSPPAYPAQTKVWDVLRNQFALGTQGILIQLASIVEVHEENTCKSFLDDS